MQKWIAALLLTGAVGCNNEDTTQNFSTVDSNVAGTPDSIPRRLYLDSLRKDTSVQVALDSAGPAVSPRDTAYPHKR